MPSLCLRHAFVVPSLLSVEAMRRQCGDNAETKWDETDLDITYLFVG